MFRRVMVTALALLLPAAAPPARADIEVATIRCEASIFDYRLTSPGYRNWEGGIACSLGRGGEVYFEEYDSFTSGLSGYVDMQERAPGLYLFVATLSFTDGDRNYTLHFEDYSVADDLAMTEMYDSVSFGHPVFKYHVRAGHLTSNPCSGCDAAAVAACELSGDCVVRGLRFVAEYVYDLPVAVVA